MITSPSIVHAINQQIGMEFFASLQYDALAAHFSAEALPRFAAHFFQQATEERMHAHKFLKYVIDVGGRVEIPAIPQPQAKFQFTRDAVKLAYDQEVKVTESIKAIYDLAHKENDHITKNFLQWFLEEQLEEMSSMDELLRIVERAGEGGLLLVEQYLAGGKKPTSRDGGAQEAS